MMRTMLKAKIHRATVTEANVEYKAASTIESGSDGCGKTCCRTSAWTC